MRPLRLYREIIFLENPGPLPHEMSGWKPQRHGGVVEESAAGGHAGCIPTCVPTPSPARRIDRRPEYRLTTVFAGFRLSSTLPPPSLAGRLLCATFRILRSLVHVSRSATLTALRRAAQPPATPTPSDIPALLSPSPPSLPSRRLYRPRPGTFSCRCIFLRTLAE